VELTKEKLIELLKGDLPGKEAQERMLPRMDFPINDEDLCREAAVLILIYPDKNELRMVFIKRNEYRGPHSGQVSFPGGMKEEFDPDLKSTAIREAAEETGILASDIEILGSMTPLFIAVSNFCVYPFVGWLNSTPEFKPDRSEVQYLICPAISELFDPKNRKTGEFNRHGTTITTPYIDISGEMVWGATAAMLGEFMVLSGY
jgi:8-oxo-dGTP pyrophosphatase MutT (NUDIX family)